MVEQEPIGADQPSGARRSRSGVTASKSPANGVRSAAKPSRTTAANGRVRPAVPQPEEEGLFAPGEGSFQSDEGLFEPYQQVRALQAQAAADTPPPPPLGHPKLGRVIHMNTARFLIALCALATLIFVVVATFITLWRGNIPVDNLMRVLEVLFAPLVALVGVAVAFYYRGNRDSP
jgi:hypothetical protein